MLSGCPDSKNITGGIEITPGKGSRTAQSFHSSTCILTMTSNPAGLFSNTLKTAIPIDGSVEKPFGGARASFKMPLSQTRKRDLSCR